MISFVVMMSTAVLLLMTLSVSLCYPQAPINIPGLTNPSFLEDVNGLAHQHQPKSSDTSAVPPNNLEETVKEVEAMLKSDPKLPRLTRGEILDLLENITKTDHQISSETVPTPVRDPKAIMVVLPYTADTNNDQAVKDLYTKAPITHIVHGQTFQKVEEVTSTESNQLVNTYTLDTDENNKPTGDKVKKFRGNYHRKSTAKPIEPATLPSTEPTKKLTIRRRRPQQQTTTTTGAPATTRSRRPVRRRPSTATTEKHPNHRYPDESTNALKVITAPKLSPYVINGDLQMVEDQNNEVLADNESSVSFERVTIREIDVEASTTRSPTNIDIPFEDDTELGSADQEQPNPLKPIQDSSASKEEQIRQMLVALGVAPSQQSTTTTQIPDISEVADNLSPDMRELLMSFGLITSPKTSLASASQVLDSFNPVEAKTDPKAYVGFKPLPEDAKTREDMEEFLAKFGLGRSARIRKGMKQGGDKVEDDELKFDMVPEEYKEVLVDIGLSNRDGKMIRSESLSKTQEKHSFNPSDTQYASNEEIEKLNKLIDVVKKLESLNRTVTDEDLKNIDMENLKELVQSLQVGERGGSIIPLNEQHAPNPNEYDYGLTKNEVKRQEDKEGDSGATPTTTPSTSEPLATPNLKDLEDSFGGNSESVTETVEPETTTARRRTGFYYLVDWNSFLDIDDQKGRRVNLRFQPTIGDPKRFYSVSVP